MKLSDTGQDRGEPTGTGLCAIDRAMPIESCELHVGGKEGGACWVGVALVAESVEDEVGVGR